MYTRSEMDDKPGGLTSRPEDDAAAAASFMNGFGSDHHRIYRTDRRDRYAASFMDGEIGFGSDPERIYRSDRRRRHDHLMAAEHTHGRHTLLRDLMHEEDEAGAASFADREMSFGSDLNRMHQSIGRSRYDQLTEAERIQRRRARLREAEDHHSYRRLVRIYDPERLADILASKRQILNELDIMNRLVDDQDNNIASTFHDIRPFQNHINTVSHKSIDDDLSSMISTSTTSSGDPVPHPSLTMQTSLYVPSKEEFLRWGYLRAPLPLPSNEEPFLLPSLPDDPPLGATSHSALAEMLGQSKSPLVGHKVNSSSISMIEQASHVSALYRNSLFDDE